MAPSEEAILSNFLLSPAPLPTVLSLQKFTELFPRRLRNHPHIRTLYRELQQIREQDMDQINGNIDQEIRQGERQKAELQKATRAKGVEAANAEEQREIDMDLHLFGQPAAGPEDYHSTSSLLAEMEAACASIEREIASVDQEATNIIQRLNTTIGDMSDLRYGKLQGPPGATGNMAEETIKGLQNLEDSCYRQSMGSGSGT
ncbi:Kinetochore subunit NKP2 [Penicillium capsulatum]|uniref:Kinetochore subunit NKP2 n=1 Tax=Penicillium capsulatum TaxID=69766 RepID=A0A9W9IJS3_9EURO|nr:Kinetochore subunit NKP2 [Penicillium capsulatum]KAJ6122404.1 Kinetochore subunit NKP2 [Penicillium capsulatum]